MHKRVLIVGTVPYNKKSPSRAFESYFSNWEKENIAQVFSNTKKPCKGHCETLYQITDKQLLSCWKSPKTETGVIYHYDELADAWTDNDLEIGEGAINKIYSLGRNHTPFTHLLRKILWRKKFWCTEKFNSWLEDFNPECVFLSFSNDFFIFDIAMYVAEKFNIPIVSCISDDYYFNSKISFSPFYYMYRLPYKARVRKLFKRKGSAIYISDKIRDKYNSEFGLDGETVYLTSEIERKPFSEFSAEKPLITYFGNITLGRNYSLNDIGNALGKINSSYVLDVYSSCIDEKVYGVFANNPNVKFHGSIPYDEVKEKMFASDMTVVVEGFEKKDVVRTRYSLSTKAADVLANGALVLAYGSGECGVIEYLRSTDAAAVCTDKEKLAEVIEGIIKDKKLQKQYYDNQITITQKHHSIKSSCSIVEAVINRCVEQGDKDV